MNQIRPAGGAITKTMQTTLNSSNLASAEYDADKQVLIIQFHNGTRYAYQDVPLRVFLELEKSESPGKYFNSFVRGKYGSAKI